MGKNKKPKLKWSEMNTKQRVFYVLDWIMRGILIVLSVVLIGTMFFSCFKSCGKDKSNSTVAYADTVIGSRSVSISLDFNSNLLSYPYYVYSGKLAPNGVDYLYLVDLPLITLTIEAINNLNDGLLTLFVADSAGTNFIVYDFGIFYTLNVELYRNLNFILRVYNSSSSQIDYNINLYFYAGDYVPGFGQGLAAGLAQGKEEGKAEGYKEGYEEGFEVGNQQGYDKGYNQGSVDMSKEYSLGLFKNASVKFAYTDNPSSLTINSFNTVLSSDYNGSVFFTDYPILTTKYKYYYLYIVFDSSFLLHTDTFYFSFSSDISETQLFRFNFYNSGGAVVDDISQSKFLPFIVTSSEHIYGVTSLPGSDVMDKYYNSCLIRFEGSNAYDYMQSMKISSTAKPDNSYFNGFNAGYTEGYEKGETSGFNTGSQVAEADKKYQYDLGYSTGFQEGFNQSDSGGFGWLISSVQSFLDTKFFGDFGIGTLLYVSLGVLLVMYFLKVLAGG